MLEINFIRQNIEKVKKACEERGVEVDLEKVLEIDKQRRELIRKSEALRASQKRLGRENLEEAKKIKAEFKKLESELVEKETELKRLLYQIPNIPFDDVPRGKDEAENVVIRKWGKPRKFDFKPRDHLEIGEHLGIIDTKTAGKVAGTRFGYLKNQAALLELALIRYAFDVLTSPKIIKKIADSVEKGYANKPFMPVIPPVMIRPEIYEKMARLSEKDKDERYYLPKDNLYLTGSAEHTLGPLHLEEVLEEKDLPLRYVGFSTCFRREAGSYGKDTRGILRVHQFDKIEMESFSLPENSRKEQDFLVAIQEYLVQSLGIPYQVVYICTGDMGMPDARQIDIECWLPGEGRYRETHTADLTTDYQSRRLGTKVRRKGKTEFVHMNDATVFAIGRTIIAILENYQEKDGSVTVPKVLRKYLKFKTIKY